MHICFSIKKKLIYIVYGKPGGNMTRAAMGKPPIGAWEVMRGDYADEDQLPDKDLGKTLTPGFRNITLETRAFGVPSIRTDLPKPGVGLTRSVANNMNYGDDATAHDLINPQPYAGINETYVQYHFFLILFCVLTAVLYSRFTHHRDFNVSATIEGESLCVL